MHLGFGEGIFTRDIHLESTGGGGVYSDSYMRQARLLTGWEREDARGVLQDLTQPHRSSQHLRGSAPLLHEARGTTPVASLLAAGL